MCFKLNPNSFLLEIFSGNVVYGSLVLPLRKGTNGESAKKSSMFFPQE